MRSGAVCVAVGSCRLCPGRVLQSPNSTGQESKAERNVSDLFLIPFARDLARWFSRLALSTSLHKMAFALKQSAAFGVAQKASRKSVRVQVRCASFQPSQTRDEQL